MISNVDDQVAAVRPDEDRPHLDGGVVGKRDAVLTAAVGELDGVVLQLLHRFRRRVDAGRLQEGPNDQMRYM